MILEPKESALRMKKKVNRRPDRIPDARHPEKVERRRIGFRACDTRIERRRRRILDARHPDKKAAQKDPGCKTSGWNGGAEGFRVCDTRMEMAAQKDSGCGTPG